MALFLGFGACAGFETTGEVPGSGSGEDIGSQGGSAGGSAGGTGGGSAGGGGTRATASDAGAAKMDAQATPVSAGTDAGGGAVVPPAGSPLSPAGAHPSDVVFDETKVRTYTLTAEPAVMDQLNRALVELRDKSNGFDDIAARFDKTYYPAVLKVDDEMVGKVQFRHKGSYGTLILCIRRNCPKLSYKIKFDNPDTKDVEERFHTLKKINLHSQVADASHLHERLGYGLFQEMKILVPRSVHARVVVNGELKGLFGATEAPDSRLLDRLFVKGAGNGNLYKESWPSEYDPNFWKSHRETNEEDPTATDAKAMTMSNAIRMAAPADLPKVLDAWLDISYVFRFWAVDRVINNWDGPVTFYCGGSVTDPRYCRNHNFFLYEQQGANRFWLIPWDLDNTFQLRARQEDVGTWDKTVDNCSSAASLFMLDAGTKLRPAQCDPVFRGLKQSGSTPYAAALKELLSGPFQVARMHKQIDTWAAQIDPHVKADTKGPGHSAWTGAVATFKRDLQTLRDRYKAMAGVN